MHALGVEPVDESLRLPREIILGCAAWWQCRSGDNLREFAVGRRPVRWRAELECVREFGPATATATASKPNEKIRGRRAIGEPGAADDGPMSGQETDSLSENLRAEMFGRVD